MKANLVDAYPLTPLQRGMLFEALAEPDTDINTAYVTFDIAGSVNIKKLQMAWEKTVCRYEVLRTVFLWEGLEQPLQAVVDKCKLDIEVETHVDRSSEQRNSLIDQSINQLRNGSFSLDQAPLMKLRLIDWGESESTMIWAIHHLLADAWSTPLVIQSVLNCYASVDSTQQGADDNEFRFSDYIGSLQSLDHVAVNHHWKQYLQNAECSRFKLAEVVLSDSALAENATRRKSHHSSQLDPSTNLVLNQFCADHSITSGTFFHAIWAVVVAAYSDTIKPVYGTLLSGRYNSQRGINNAVGAFINTLPACVSLNDNQSLIEWMRNLQSQLQENQHFEAADLTKIRRFFSDETEASPFDSVIVIEPDSVYNEIVSDDNSITAKNFTYQVDSSIPLTLMVFKSGAVNFRFEYDPGRFQSGVIAQMQVDLFSLIGNALTTPAQTSLELLNQVLAPYSPISATFGTGNRPVGPASIGDVHSVSDWFSKTASLEQGKQALIHAAGETSYRELKLTVDALASRLQKVGATHSDIVAICVTAVADQIISMLGILEAGCTYLVVDPETSSDRLRTLVNKSQFPVAITDNLTTSRFDDLPVRTTNCAQMPLETTQVQTKPMRPTIIDHQVAGDDLAYVLFTSGSTGKPKGVKVTHSNLIYSTLARLEYYQVNKPCFMLVSPTTFDSSVAGIYWTLLGGGKLVLPERDEVRDIQRIAALIAEQAVDTILCLPTFYKLLHEGASSFQLTSLRQVILAGEACSRDIVDLHFSKLPDTSLYNEYGPTECTVWSSVAKLEAGQSTVSIGTPIPGSQVSILDSRGCSVPHGVCGEISVAGPGVSRGYLNDNTETAERFINCEPGEPFETLYRTGDLGSFATDGQILFHGRLDRQIKIRGHRIEPAEVELIVRENSKISDVAVVGRTRPVSETEQGSLTAVVGNYSQLDAYITIHTDKQGVGHHGSTGSDNYTQFTEAASREIFNCINEKLPTYMQPANLIVIDEIPRSRHGKIDTQGLLKSKALATHANIRNNRTNANYSPEAITKFDQKIFDKYTGIAKDLLGVSEIFPEDTFYELGGDSITAIMFVSRARENGLDCNIKQITDQMSFAAIVSELSSSELSDTNTGVDQLLFDKFTASAKDLLGVSQIFPEDTFYELGGDSITAIMFVSRARENGFDCNIKQITDQKTFAAILEELDLSHTSYEEKPDSVSPIGATPLTPIQKWYFSLEHPNPVKWNIAYRAQFTQTMEFGLLEESIISVLQKYPSLGTKFRSSSAGWNAEIPDALPVGKVVQVSENELASKGNSYHETLLSNIADTWSLEEGALYGFLIVSDDSGNVSELNIIAHHLILDHFSVDLLIRSIINNSSNISKQDSRDSVQAVSVRQYAKIVDAELRLDEDAKEDGVAILPDWANFVEPSKATHLPSTTEKSCCRAETCLDKAETEKLLQATKEWDVNMLEVVTAAVLSAWTQVCTNIQIDTYIETSGRDRAQMSLDLTNLLAWVTVFFPLNFKISERNSCTEILKNVRNELRSHPEEHALFLAWYYQHNTLPPTAASSQKSLLVNYLGDISQKNSDDSYLLSAFQGSFLRSDDAIRAFDLEINAYRENAQLVIKWHIASTIESDLAEQLTTATADELRKLDTSKDEGHLYTPSDFNALSLSQDELDKLIDDIG